MGTTTMLDEVLYQRAGIALGQFNLGLFGPSGAGKSTLVNSIFGVSLAETGVGGPVTQEPRLYRPAGSKLGVLDTKGLEVGTGRDQIMESLTAFIAHTRGSPISEQLHVVWYCTSYQGRRFTDGDAALVRGLVSLNLPVLIVITQVPTNDGEPASDVMEFTRSISERRLPCFEAGVQLVNAEPDEFDGLGCFGLTSLLEATRRAAPQGVRGALDAAQTHERGWKRRTAEQTIEETVGRLRLMPDDPPDSWAQMVFGISIVYGVPAGPAIEVLQGSPLYQRMCVFHSNARGRMLRPVLDSTTRAIGQSWRECCDTVWRPPYMGGPTWKAPVMSTILESALKRHLHRFFTFDT